MRVFRPANIDEIRLKRYKTYGDFLRAVSRAAPDYRTRNGKILKPADNHIRDILNGERSPGVAYLALFADLFKCQTDDFFVKVDPK